MKVTGFSFIKNAVKLQYPVAEALRSILPLCDEVVVAVGDCNDGTRELVQSLDPKIRIIDTVWEHSQPDGGHVLAVETNKAFHAISPDSDWCVYIQGDEVLHEDGHAEIRNAMQRWKNDKQVDGLLLKYRHFYGSFDYLGASSRWYKKEIRIIRNDKNIYSYRDAQGFRKGDNQKLRVKPLNAYMHHYGWVREPKAMFLKSKSFSDIYSGTGWSDEMEKSYSGEFDYSEIDALKKFEGTHPKVMQERIAAANWKFDFDPTYNKLKFKDRFKNLVEAITGRRPFDHNNYKIT
ncbi:MAG: glycosyl transferase [Flaviaesturariibacter sp.]|nr:glycosyl transferase [Flaviaesturariibacter sp.]